jgi:CheY-like chemotaxis protein
MDRNRTALVIDPDAAQRQFVALRLEILGFKVREAENQVQVKNALREGDVDLVVTDMGVPGLEGTALWEVLEPADRPVFLLTEWTCEDPGSYLKETQIRAIVTKKKRTDLFKLIDSLGPLQKSEAGEKKSSVEKHILLIEDSPTIRQYVRRILEKGLPNCVVREASEGRDAISEMAQKKVDLIITDLQMPGMDGPTFLRMIRRNNLLKQKPVLVFSSSDSSQVRSEFGSDSCMEFLLKPASAEQILGAVERLWACQESPLKNLVR